jgi:hypothetical protein
MSALPAGRPDAPPSYEIRLRGLLGPRWAAWFDGMTVTTTEDGTTALRGPVTDQAALHGLLQKVRDLGLPLLSVTPLDPTSHAPLPTDPPPPHGRPTS